MTMELGIRGKAAFITGAAGGIGSATARVFAAEGAAVALFDKNAQGAQQLLPTWALRVYRDDLGGRGQILRQQALFRNATVCKYDVCH